MTDGITPKTSVFPEGLLSSFFGTEVQQLELAKCQIFDQNDPRKDKQLPEWFIENIAVNGQLSPALAYPLEEGRFAIISGNQRLKALRALARKGEHRKLAALVAIPQMGSLEQVIAAAATNEAVLPNTPTEQAFFITKTLELCNGNNSETARRIGVDEKTVRNARLFVQQASNQLRESVESGAIPMTRAVGIIESTKDKEGGFNKAAQIKAVNDIIAKAKEAAEKGEKPKVVLTAEQVENAKPSAGLLKQLVETGLLNPIVAAVLQWVTGGITKAEFLSAVPSELPAFNKLASASTSKAEEAEKKRKEAEAKKAEKEAEKKRKEDEKAAEKARIDAMSEDERKTYKAAKEAESLRKRLAKIEASENATSDVLKPAGKPKAKPKAKSE